MPRLSNGLYQLPSGNPVTSGTTITADWANRTLPDIATALSNTLTADGTLPMTAPMKFADGSVIAPGITFNSDSSTGIYRKTTSTLGLTANGVDALVLNTTGGSFTGNLSVAGTTTFTGATTHSGAVSLASTLNVTGATSLSSLTTSGNTSVGGTLTVTGATTHTGALSGSTASFTGTVTAPLFSGSGASLTNIPTSALASPTFTLGSTTLTVGGSTTSLADLQLTGTPIAPTAAVGTNTTQVATTAFVQAGMRNYMPSGVIVMWSGSIAAIPSGWALCNGLNGTPNLQDRFIVGAGNSYAVGATGGAATVALTVDQLPSHSHGASAWTDQQGSHQHGGGTSGVGDHQHISPWGESDARGATWGVSGGTGYQGSGQTDWDNYQYMTSPAGNHSHSITTDWQGQHGHNVGVSIGSTGSGNAHENRPPYYALAYIMKL